jgi:hypothetical protein
MGTIIFRGVLGIFSSYIVCKILSAFGWGMAGTFAAVLIGILMPILALNKSPGNSGLMIGLFGSIFAGIIPAIMNDYKGFGYSRQQVLLSDIKNYPFTTVFSLEPCHVERKLSGYEPIMGRTSKVGEVYAVPVVPDGWTPDQEIYAWALSDWEGDRSWDKSCAQAVQMVENDDARDAIEDALHGVHFPSHPKLKTSKDAVLLKWTCNAKAEWWGTQRISLLLPIVISIIYIIVAAAGYKRAEP